MDVKVKCPICGGTDLNCPTNVECVTLLFVEKGQQDINIGQNLECSLFICKTCKYIMLFKS